MLTPELLEIKNSFVKNDVIQNTKTPSNLDDAIQAWVKIFGIDRLTFKTKTYQENTIDSNRNIPAVLHLKNTAEIVKAIQVANHYRIKVYPISTGKNWGYGSAMPVDENNVIFDLGGMNTIKNFDAELGIVTVEPGVTQQDLYNFLQKTAPQYLVPVTGAGPHCSILGNALERGYGITPHTDHFASVYSLEAVLPNGEIYRSYFSSMRAEEINHYHKWGMGPYLDGIFTQSNMGVVTEITIHLKRKPEAIEFFAFRIKKEEQLEKAVQIIHKILNEVGENLSGINLMNDNRVISMTTKYPFEELKADYSNRDEIFQKIAKKYSITPWTGIGAIYGPKKVVKAVKQIIVKKLKQIDKMPIFMNRKKLNFIKSVQKWIPLLQTEFLNNSIEKVESTLNILEGIPQKLAIPLAYWKNTSRPYEGHHANHNPATDNCGLIWFTPLIPLRSNDLRAYTNAITRICKANKIEPLITMTTLSEKVVDSSVPLLFDRNKPEECKNAKKCYLELYEECKKLGYLPYRMGIDHMELTTNQKNQYWSLVNKIKEAIDPEHIISPGRYCPMPNNQ